MAKVLTGAAQDGSPVKVFSKVAALLDLLAQEGDLTPAEIAQRLDEPRSTMYRLLAALEAHDFVQPGPRPRSFELGLRLFSLGSVVRRRFDDLRAAALPSMERLHDLTRQTIFLVVRRDLEALCIERIDGELVQLMVLPAGGSIGLHGGAAARVLLAHEPPELWEQLFAEGELYRFTPRTPVTRTALFADLEQIRQEGFSVSDGDVIPGIASIGAPIFDHRGAIRAGLSVSGPHPSVLGDSYRSVRDQVCEAAREISERLGYLPAAKA